MQVFNDRNANSQKPTVLAKCDNFNKLAVDANRGPSAGSVNSQIKQLRSSSANDLAPDHQMKRLGIPNLDQNPEFAATHHADDGISENDHLSQESKLSRPKPGAHGQSPLQPHPTGAHDLSPGEMFSDEEILFQGRQPRVEEREVAHEGLSSDRPASAASGVLPQSTLEASYIPKAKRQRMFQSSAKFPMSNDSAIADYLANLAANEGGEFERSDIPMSMRDLGGALDWPDDEDKPGRPEDPQDSWDSSFLEDLDQLSTSSDELQRITKILARRLRGKSVQFLVVGAGLTTDDAKWLSKLQLSKLPEAARLVGEFEDAAPTLDPSYETNHSESSILDDEQIEHDVQDDFEDAQHERDLMHRHKVDLPDEKLARLLNKQEELGLGSRNLIMFDGRELECSTDEHVTMGSQTLKARNGVVKPKEWRSRARQIPNVSKGFGLFDGHESSDLLDRADWASGKSKSANLHFGLSDSDLEHKLRTSWEKDRTKKKARKKEREELRAQGLLGGRRKGKVDLQTKHASGMRLHEIMIEIKHFLKTSEQDLALPPMNPQARKVVHEGCHKLGLLSKSRGIGRARFPVLYKTSRTLPFTDEAFAGVRRQLYPPLKKPKATTMKVRRNQKTRPENDGSYRDGEVVGGSAPELDQANRGRAMLEKMGWSNGTVLGAIHNPGIAVPVSHVVKTSRAGLG